MRLFFCYIFLIISTGVVCGQHSFCENNKRITPVNYTFLYDRIQNQIFESLEENSSHDIFHILENCPKGSGCINEELCLHNRFLFADFLFYFELTERYSAYSDLEHDAYYIRLLETRDLLYKQWLQSLKYKTETGYCEWENGDLAGESFYQFLERGSQKFGWIEKIVAEMNAKPGKNHPARKAVHEMLSARTPFSCIMPFEAKSLIENEKTQGVVDCLNERIQDADCSDNLFEMALNCTENDSGTALSVLGILCTQRMYFIRDWKAWLEQNLDEQDFKLIFATIKKSSQIYFYMETFAFRCSPLNIYPRDISTGEPGHKAYHFWSTAVLSYKLAEHGFSKEVAVKEATRPAKKYKLFIQFPGIAYNLMLKNPLFAGTAGDYKNVIEEQNLGAIWGYELFKNTVNKKQ